MRKYSMAALVAPITVISLVGLSSCSSKSPEPGSSSASAHATEVRPTGTPGGITGVNMQMPKPSGSNSSSVVTGTMTNFGASTTITSCQAFVSTSGSCVLRKGTSKVSGIPAPNGTNTKTTIPLTASGYNIELVGVDLTLDSDGQITLNVFGQNGTVSQLQVTVDPPPPSPTASSSKKSPLG